MAESTPDMVMRCYGVRYHIVMSRLELGEVVPVDTGRHLDSAESKVNKVRLRLMMNQRLIVLAQLGQESRNPEFFPSGLQTFYHYISYNIEENDDIVAPQHVQFFSKILFHFTNNPSDMVSVAIAGANIPELMTFMAYSIIPSFFGFFSSLEHLGMAFPFYCLLIVKATKPICRIMLQPFYKNACSYRYIEAVNTDMISFFCQDARLVPGVSARIIQEHAETFIESMIKHACLLPSTHLSILTMLHRNQQWTPGEVFEFFVNDVVVPCVTEHLKASPFGSHHAWFPMLIKAVLDKITDGDIEPLFASNSIFEVPPGFTEFLNDGLVFVTTPFDIGTFMSVAGRAIVLPKLLEMLQTPEYLADTRYKPVVVRVFRKTPQPMSYWNISRRVVFPDANIVQDLPDIPHFERRYRTLRIIGQPRMMTPVQLLSGGNSLAELEMIREFGMTDHEHDEEGISFREYAKRMELNELNRGALTFERLLIHRFALERLRSWGMTVEMTLHVSLMATVEHVLVKYFHKTPFVTTLTVVANSSDVLRSLSHVFDMKSARLLFGAMRAEVVLYNYLEVSGRRAEFEELERKWIKLVDTIGPQSLPPEIQSQYGAVVQKVLELVNMISSLNVVSFHKSFARILRSLEMLDIIGSFCGSGDSLVTYAVRLCNSRKFISTIVKLSAVLLKRPKFVSDLTREEVVLWYQLENSVTHVLEKDVSALRLYHNLHDRMVVLV